MRDDQVRAALDAVRARVDRFFRQGNPAEVFGPAADDEFTTLLNASVVPDSEGVAVDVEGLQAAAFLAWCRFVATRAMPEPGDPHRALAADLVGLLDQAAPHLVPPEFCDALLGGSEAITDRELLARADHLLRSSVANGDADGVGQAIKILRSLLDTMREPDPLVRLILSGSLLDLHNCGGPLESLDEAIDLSREVAGMVGPADPLASRANALLGVALLARFRSAGSALSDLEEAQYSLERALATGPDRSPLFELSHVLYERAVLNDDVTGLDAVIKCGVEVRGVLSPGDVRRWQAERVLGLAYGMRHDRVGDPADLDKAIDALYACMPAEMLPIRVRRRPDQLAHDAVELLTRLAQRASLAPEHEFAARCDECVAAAREAAEWLPDDGGVLGSLAIALRVRAQDGDLDEAVTILERLTVAERTPPVLRELLKALRTRYAVTHDDADRNRAIEVTNELLGMMVGDDPARAELELELGMALLGRADTTGTAADALAAATALGRAANGTDQPLLVVTSLTAALAMYYRGTDIGPDDDVAAEPVLRLAAMLDALPEGAEVEHGLAATALAMAEDRRFRRIGDAAALTAAIGHLQDALRNLPDEHDSRREVLTSLGSLLTGRAAMYWSRFDAMEAVRIHQVALVGVADDDPNLPSLLVNLGDAIRNGAEMSLNPAHLEAAIAAYREALAFEANSELAIIARTGLGSALCRLFEIIGKRDLLDEAIAHLRDAARATDVFTKRRAAVHNQLAVALGTMPRDEQTTAQLTEKIKLLTEGIPSADATIRGGMALNLAEALRLRRGDGDGMAARAHYRAAAGAPGLDMWARAYAARMWGALSSFDGDHAEAIAGYTAAVDLLPSLAWRGLQRVDQQRALRRVAPIASEAAEAALAAGHPETAVELLEHGRSVLWDQLMAARTDVGSGALAAAAEIRPELVDKLVQVRAVLASLTDGEAWDYTSEVAVAGLLSNLVSLPPALMRRQLHMSLAHSEEQLLTEIAALPGVGAVTRRCRFAELAAAGREGPVVVINVGRSCHALVLDGSDKMRVIELKTSHEEVNARAQSILGIRPDDGVAGYATAQQTLAEVLDWAWHTIVWPVLNKVQPPEGGRVWWCPTGPLSLIPLHAAADYTSPMPERGALDRVVSSYTLTVTALLDGRTKRAASDNRTLIVGVPDADGRPPLAMVPDEVALVAELSGATSTTLVGPDATRERLLAELPRHSSLHLAGHGRQDLIDPSGSCLQLHDGLLTVKDLTKLHLDEAEFAFLSACETSTAAVIPDEAIHPAAALQFAGFRRVVATLWPIPDHVGVQMADDIYRDLRSGPTNRTAHALHTATRNLRDQHPYEPSIWSSYIYWGP